jgi:hypothetical protein
MTELYYDDTINFFGYLFSWLGTGTSIKVAGLS